MTETTEPFDPVDVSRRKVVKIVLAASAVAVPVVSSVALGGVSPAFAESPNISGQTTTVGTTTVAPVDATTTAGTTAAPATETTTETPTTTPAPVTTRPNGGGGDGEGPISPQD